MHKICTGQCGLNEPISLHVSPGGDSLDGHIRSEGENYPMLEQVISKARRMVKDAQQRLSVESASVVEQAYTDIVTLNNFINGELSVVESKSSLDESSKKVARRGVFEQAGRKLEIIKAKMKYPVAEAYQEVEPNDRSIEEDMSLLRFFQEKEVRDRLYLMTETQILSLFGESLFDGSNPLLTGAILNAPPGFEPVSKEVVEKMATVSLPRPAKVRPQRGESLRVAGRLNMVVGDMFNLVKNELDSLRRKELPTALAQSKNSKDRPFKF